jgi:molybdopterin-binding protein
MKARTFFNGSKKAVIKSQVFSMVRVYTNHGCLLTNPSIYLVNIDFFSFFEF